MDEDSQDGPYTVWQMFNAPIVALFKNLPYAGDGLETLLTSILKSTRDFTEVLVCRPGLPKSTEYQYKSFNSWLLGCLFHIWSVKELERIHHLSLQAQLKILQTLGLNAAAFFNDLQNEYIVVLHKLADYYSKQIASSDPSSLVLENFTPEKLDIQNIDLNLDLPYVEIKDISTCTHILELLLKLLSETIPLHTLATDVHDKQYEDVFEKVLAIIENYNLDLKVIGLDFFLNLIRSYEKVAITKFCNKFAGVIKQLMHLIEQILLTVPVYQSSGDLSVNDTMKLNTTVCELLHSCLYHTKKNCTDVISNIAHIVLESDSKVITHELKAFCLSISVHIQLSESIITLDNLSRDQITLLTPLYVKQIVQALQSNSPEGLTDKLNNSFHYIQLKTGISKLSALETKRLDNFVIHHHIENCVAILNILLSVHYMQKSDKPYLINDSDTKSIIQSLTKCIALHRNAMQESSATFGSFVDIILALAILNPSACEEKALVHLICLQKCPEFSDQELRLNEEMQAVVLKYLLVVNLVLNRKMSELWSRVVNYLLKALSKNKSSDHYAKIIELAPLLLLNNIINASKLIAEHLSPAFVSKKPKIQNELLNILPTIACLALGSYAVIIDKRTYTIDKGIRQVINDISHGVFKGIIDISVICSKCHRPLKTDRTSKEFLMDVSENNCTVLVENNVSVNDSINIGQRNQLAKFLNAKMYTIIDWDRYLRVVERFSHHTILSNSLATEVFSEQYSDKCVDIMGAVVRNVMADMAMEDAGKESIFNTCIDKLVYSTKTSLETNDYAKQTRTLDNIKHFGLCHPKALLPTTKLLVYFIMYPSCSVSRKAAVYLREICEGHDSTPNQVYHKYKKDYCRLFVDCSLHNGERFAMAILKVVRAFGFEGYRDFISKDVHHFLPYLVPYVAILDDIPTMIEEIAALVQISPSEFLTERFPHIYTHVYLFESEIVAKKSFKLIENMTGTSVLTLIKRHFRVILTEFLLQYCCNPEKVIQACKYLAFHDPENTNLCASPNMSVAQISDFLNPRFLGILAYFDNKLINSKVALSVKRKALQSFPDIMKLMGTNYLTPLRFKVLATLRSALSLAEEFPKILANAWSAFVHNVDSISLGPMLPNLAVSLLQQSKHAPNEINKIMQYLVISNENLLSAYIPDLFFLENENISDKVRVVIQRHVKRTQPEGFLDKLKWYMAQLSQDIADVKSCAYKSIDKLLKCYKSDLHDAIFNERNMNPVIVELIDALIAGCRSSERCVRVAAAHCVGQLGCVGAPELPRAGPAAASPHPAAAGTGTATASAATAAPQQFAFALSDDAFAVSALHTLCSAAQYERDTKNMDCYALSIQEILKLYGISPDRRALWDQFPPHMHQIMLPLLSSRYTLAFPSQPKKTHPLYGSCHGTTFMEWAFNWAGQLVALAAEADVRAVLSAALPSMKRDARTLLLCLPYALLHAVMAPPARAHHYIRDEMMAVIGPESLKREGKSGERLNEAKILRHPWTKPTIAAPNADDGNQYKCSKVVYTLLDFLNKWLMEWFYVKQNPTQNEHYKRVKSFVDSFDCAVVARGSLASGEVERALQYLERHAQPHALPHAPYLPASLLPRLAELYALLDEPDAVAGILSLKSEEPTRREAILAHVATARLHDAALCYERLALEGPRLPRHALQGMVECYMGLEQPYAAYRLLLERGDARDMRELGAGALLRLGSYEQLDQLLRAQETAGATDTWHAILGGAVLAVRAADGARLQAAVQAGAHQLCAALYGPAAPAAHAARPALRYACALLECEHADELVRTVQQSEESEGSLDAARRLLEQWRLRGQLARAHCRSVEPLLRDRRTLLHVAQERLSASHPRTCALLREHAGELWLQSAKHARTTNNFHLAYTYIVAAEEYKPAALFVERGRLHWARGQQEQAFATLRRELATRYPGDALDRLTPLQRKICAKAKLLIAQYSEETRRVDVDVNIGYYKEAVDAYKQWEKSLVALGTYYDRVSTSPGAGAGEETVNWTRRLYALNCYGKSLQYGHKQLYQSMPRMLSIWLETDASADEGGGAQISAQMTEIIRTYSDRLPLYLFLTAFSQIVSRICHPNKQVYAQVKALLVRLVAGYPHHALWMLLCVAKSAWAVRARRCADVLADPQLKRPAYLRLVHDHTALAEKLIDLCNKPIASNTATVSEVVRSLPKLLASEGFSPILMPHEQFTALALRPGQPPPPPAREPPPPPVHIAAILEKITVVNSLQKPRKVTLVGSDGKHYNIMLKPKDDLRKDFRLMEFTSVVNRFLRKSSGEGGAGGAGGRLYLRSYAVFPLNEECGLVQWLDHLLGLRPALLHIYRQSGLHTSNKELKEMMCRSKDPIEKKRRVFEEQLLPRHPPVFHLWFLRTFPDPCSWYQARSAYIRTTAVISMVGYVLGLGDRHGENVCVDCTSGDTVHVDFNCLFNKGEGFEWPERVPFRLTHNMRAALGPLQEHDPVFKKSCEVVMGVLRAQSETLMSVIRPFVYDPLVSWGRARQLDVAERVNEQARDSLAHIRQRLHGIVRTKSKQLSLSLSPEGQVAHLIEEATSVHNLCQMYIGWGPFL